MNTTDEARALIAEARQHDEAMTEAPWVHHQVINGNGEVGYDAVRDPNGRTIAYDSDGSESDFEECNARGIAWLRTNLRALLDVATAALEENELAEHVIGRLRKHDERQSQTVFRLGGLLTEIAHALHAENDEQGTILRAIADLQTIASAQTGVIAESNNLPSIAELQRMCGDEQANHDVDLALAAPVLLEIVAAALAYRDAECTGVRCEHPAHRAPCAILSTQDTFNTALAKVRRFPPST
jgi:hypothetical protein